MNNYLWQAYHRLINELEVTTHRFLYDSFELKQRLIGIVGARGVGKTTMMLQYIREHLYDAGKTFYFTADNTYFNEITIVEFVNQLYQERGITHVFIDEIHKYPNWNQELKNLYDSFPSMHIVFSGSSSIDLIRGSYDLSRRAKLIKMPGLSFREYLNLTTEHHFEAMSLDDLIKNHTKIAENCSDKIMVLEHFERYKKFGYYPFILNDQDALYATLEMAIDKTINGDIAEFYQLKTASLKYFKRIINFLTTIPPGKVNASNIARHLSVDYKTVDHYLEILTRTGMVKMLYPAAHGNQVLNKASKIYLDNSTLLSAVNAFLSSDLEIGTQRELVFLQSIMGAGLNIFYPQKGDFKVGNMVFEIGGKNKTGEQLVSVEECKIIVKDNILVGFQNQIPLYLFGFLY